MSPSMMQPAIPAPKLEILASSLRHPPPSPSTCSHKIFWRTQPSGKLMKAMKPSSGNRIYMQHLTYNFRGCMPSNIYKMRLVPPIHNVTAFFWVFTFLRAVLGAGFPNQPLPNGQRCTPHATGLLPTEFGWFQNPLNLCYTLNHCLTQCF